MNKARVDRCAAETHEPFLFSQLNRSQLSSADACATPLHRVLYRTCYMEEGGIDLHLIRGNHLKVLTCKKPLGHVQGAITRVMPTAFRVFLRHVRAQYGGEGGGKGPYGKHIPFTAPRISQFP